MGGKRRGFRKRKSRLGLWASMAIVLLLAAYLAVLDFSQPNVGGEALRLDEFADLVERDRITSALLLDQDSYVVGTYLADDGSEVDYNLEYLRTASSRERLVDLLYLNRVPFEIDQQIAKSYVLPATLLIPALIVVVVFVYLILSYRRGSGLFGVTSGARRIEAQDSGVTFADVAGQDAAVAELRELSLFLSDPGRFAAVGAEVPKGVLLYGPPGCGKTLLARGLAGEAGAAFFSISGSDFVELYAGVGAARVRDLFAEARANAPAIVFIDELDSVGRRRSARNSGSGEEQEQALNQILAEMDGFTPSAGVIVIGATNRPNILDPALLRPGRFDRTVGLEAPDAAGRAQILAVHARKRRLAPGVDLAAIAERAVGLSGADLASVMNEAAILAARAGKQAVGQEDLEVGVQRILEAPERQRRLSLREREVGRRYAGGSERVTFADVAGLPEVVEELAEVRSYLADPGRYTRMGARVPRGILVDGPPGCGKTLLARALAGEANAAFLYADATEFVEVFVGEGAARVRDLFAEARALAPAILFIDEIDAIGAQRSATSLDGHREREQTLNQILIALDGFEARSGVIAIAATNRPDILDAALVRPGRFDRHITVNLPDRSRRLEILELHARGKPLAADVDLDAIARVTQGFSGAALANVLNEAVLLATRRGLDHVPMALVDEAFERAVLGVAPVSRLMGEQERRMVAYHEAGHALVGRALAGARVPHRLTIIPKGPALGVTWGGDADDRRVHSRTGLLDVMAGALGGRVAEELAFGEPGSGAADDLARVGDIARQMVTELGMSQRLGALAYPGGRSSDELTRTIEAEVRALVDEAQARAREVLVAERDALDRVAEALLEQETLSSTEFEAIAAASPPRKRRAAARR